MHHWKSKLALDGGLIIIKKSGCYKEVAFDEVYDGSTR